MVQDSSFFDSRATTFDEAARAQSRPLIARYNPNGWGLEDVGAYRDRVAGCWLLPSGTPEDVRHFQNVAGELAVALGSPNRDGVWADWLDHLRRQPIGVTAIRSVFLRPGGAAPDPNAEAIETKIIEIADVFRSSSLMARTIASKHRMAELAENHATASGDGVTRSARRRAFVIPRLQQLNMSPLDWAQATGDDGQAAVDYNTVNDFLNGTTKVLRTNSRTRLARALGCDPHDLPG